jgi:cytochrome b561
MWRNTEKSYGRVARWLHWCLALMILMQLLLGYLTQALAADPALQFAVYQWHKSLGMLVLALAFARLAWTLAGVRPLPVPGLSAPEAVAAQAVHRLLLMLTILVPLAGWAVVSSSTLGIPVYLFDTFAMPNLPLTVSDQDEAFWSRFHTVLAYGLGVLVVVHVGAALYHHVVRGDDSLRRMMGMRPRSGDDAG